MKFSTLVKIAYNYRCCLVEDGYICVSRLHIDNSYVFSYVHKNGNIRDLMIDVSKKRFVMTNGMGKVILSLEAK